MHNKENAASQVTTTCGIVPRRLAALVGTRASEAPLQRRTVPASP